jgi:hypothetical protein
VARGDGVIDSNFKEPRASQEAVILRESGGSSTPQLPGSIIDVSEYWIARWSLSSGAHSRDPVAGDDG